VFAEERVSDHRSPKHPRSPGAILPGSLASAGSGAASLGEIHGSVERARSFALQWLHLRDRIMHSVDEMERSKGEASRPAKPDHGPNES
jgi:hypothetical protein